jgi:hypothetical protein
MNSVSDNQFSFDILYSSLFIGNFKLTEEDMQRLRVEEVFGNSKNLSKFYEMLLADSSSNECVDDLSGI